MMKNASYFVLKALFVLEIFKFLPRVFGHVVGKMLTLKFMTSSPGLQQTIATRIGNQTMKFGQLMEYIRIIFL